MDAEILNEILFPSLTKNYKVVLFVVFRFIVACVHYRSSFVSSNNRSDTKITGAKKVCSLNLKARWLCYFFLHNHILVRQSFISLMLFL